MAQSKKEVKTVEESTELANFGFENDIGSGMEGTDRESFAIPFLRVIQKGSPQVDEADGAYIEGAKPGMLINSVTQELMPGDGSVEVLHCAYQRRFLRWAPRGSDVGFKGEYMPEDVVRMRERGDVVEDEGKLLFPTDDGKVDEKKCDRLVDTRSHFMILLYGDEVQQVVLPLSSTQIKKSKQLMSMLNNKKVKTSKGMVTPPTWVNRFQLSTVPESNDQGSWHGVKFTPAGFIEGQDIYDMGKSFHEAIQGGEAHANYAEAEAEAGGGATSEDEQF